MISLFSTISRTLATRTLISRTFVRPLLLSGALVTMGALLAHADVRYTQQLRIEGMEEALKEMPGGGQGLSSTTTYKRPGAERTETVMKLGPVQQKSVLLSLCSTQQLITLDPDLKIYYSESLVPVSTEGEPLKPAAQGAKPRKITGTITSTLVSLKDLGAQTVGGNPTHAYEVVIRTQTSGCLGNNDNTSKQQIWFGHAATDNAEDGCSNAASNSPEGDGGNCHPAMIRKGNWALYDKITRGVPVKTRYFDPEGKPQMEMTTTDVSHAKLPAALFEVPAGFKRVSKGEFDRAKQESLMKAMQSQAMQAAVRAEAEKAEGAGAEDN